MKKFYTLLSAALLGTMMVSAAVRVTEAKPSATLEAKQFNTTQTFSTEKVAVNKKATSYKAPAKAAAADAAAVTGEYLFKAYARNFDSATNGLPSAYWMNESVPYIEVAEDNSVTIEGFWDATFNLTGTYDPEAGTITIPYTQKVTVPTSTGSIDLCVYVINFDTKVASDLVLNVDAANRLLTWTPADNGQQYLETLIIGTYGQYSGSQIYDQLYDCAFNRVNAIMSWNYVDENGDFVIGEDGNYETESTYVYAEKSTDGYTVYNFCDFSPYQGYEGCFDLPVNLSIDKEAHTLTATNQALPFSGVDFYLCGVDNTGYFQLENPEVIFVGDEIEIAENYTVTDFYTEVLGILGVVGQNMYGADFYDVELLLLEPAFSGSDDAGIASVVVDNNQNAPVEYFNLQGVRVENPSAGLYIRRQGNQTIKVLVK